MQNDCEDKKVWKIPKPNVSISNEKAKSMILLFLNIPFFCSCV